MRTLALCLAAIPVAACILSRDGAFEESGTGGSGPAAQSSTASEGPTVTTGPNSTIGDCMQNAGEQCDDCNTTSGDGCDSQGQVEPGWVCTAPGKLCNHVSGVITTERDTTDQVGNQSATPKFEEPCPEGAMLVGINATDSGLWQGGSEFLTFVVPRCAFPQIAGGAEFLWTEAEDGPTFGGNGVSGAISYGIHDCPPNRFLMGFSVWADSYNYPYPTGLELLCGPMRVIGENVAIDAPTDNVGPFGYSDQTSTDLVCPASQVATALTGSAGAVLDLVGLGCSSAIPTLCGDDVVEGAETCDDGNSVSGDGCSDTCRDEGQGP
ncbi:MAG TPA: DUF4215 domain-containing protein [Polyangiaceae bacterium]|nr:DUF4215 domain-containing protein [Polyangiaceae bacterium]